MSLYDQQSAAGQHQISYGQRQYGTNGRYPSSTADDDPRNLTSSRSNGHHSRETSRSRNSAGDPLNRFAEGQTRGVKDYSPEERRKRAEYLKRKALSNIIIDLLPSAVLI